MRIDERCYMLPDGREITIKSAGPEDALKTKLHREKVSAETHFLAREPEDGPWNLEMIRARFENIANDGREFMVNAYLGDELIGELGITTVRPHIKYLHRAYLGMSVLQEYTGMGLGSFMMAIALEQARANGYEQVELGVYSDNARARHLYSKMGFKEYGINPRAFKLPDGTYNDEIIMAYIYE